MARHRPPRTLVLLGCLCCFALYLIFANHIYTLGLAVSWSRSAVQRVRSWEGHRQLSLLVVVPSLCGELAQTSEDRCLRDVSSVCRDFSSRACIIKQGVARSTACEQPLLQQKGRNDIKQAYVVAQHVWETNQQWHLDFVALLLQAVHAIQTSVASPGGFGVVKRARLAAEQPQLGLCHQACRHCNMQFTDLPTAQQQHPFCHHR